MIETTLILGLLVVEFPGIGITKFNEDYQNIQNADLENLVDYMDTIQLRADWPVIECDEWARTYATDTELLSSFEGPICSFTGHSRETIHKKTVPELLSNSLGTMWNFGRVFWGRTLLKNFSSNKNSVQAYINEAPFFRNVLKGLKANLNDPDMEKKALEDSERDILIIEEKIGPMESSSIVSQNGGSVSERENSGDGSAALHQI